MLVKKINSEHKFKLRYIFFSLFTFVLGYILVILENNINISIIIANILLLFIFIIFFIPFHKKDT